MTYDLVDIPHALGNADGTLTKTNKAELMKIIAEQVPDCEETDARRFEPAALILDGMVLLRQLRGQQISQTFGDLSHAVLDCVANKTAAAGATSVHVVWDTYPEVSIKSAEQARRRAATEQ